MPKPNEFTSLNELFANLNKTITGIIQDENGSVVKAGIDALKTSVQENVYDVYDPYLYERTGELKEEWKVEKEDGGIAIMSNRYDGNTYVAQVVETGVGYRYSFLFDGTPRPFTQLAAEELQGTGKLTLALSNELKKRGFRFSLESGELMAAQKKLPPISDEWFKENVHEFNQEVTQEFIDQQHLSPETLKTYKSNLYQFFKFVHDNCSNKSILKLRKKDALKYQNFLLKNGLSPNATKNKRATVSSLCNYIMLYYEDEREFRNIFNGVPNPSKSVVHKKTPLTKDEFDILVSHFTEKGNWQIVAYLWFVYETGARREEVRQLKREVVYYSYFVDQETGEETDYYESHDIRAKGRGAEGKRRKFYFGDQAMDALKKWHDARGADECPYMFVKKTKDGKTQQLSPTTFNYWCSKYFSEILGKRVHPHLFRSTRATHLVVNEGYDIEAAQELLGHESSETTQIYVVKEGGQNMSKIFKKKK